MSSNRNKRRGGFSAADRETARKISLGQNVTSFLNNLVKWGAVCFIAFEVVQCVVVLAGKETKANILVGVLADIGGKDRTVEAILAAVVLVLWFLLARTKTLLGATITELGKLRASKELAIDPRRSSSKLSTTGETRPEDDDP